MIMDENACIEKVLLGDAAAYEFLVGKYQSRLVAFLWNLLGCGEDARDAAQEVFIKAYFHLGEFDRSRSFKSWLFAIAYNRGIDLLRKRRNFLRFRQQETAGGRELAAAAGGGSIEESPLWRPLLRKNTAQERAVLALRYNEDCSANEIAAALGCSASTVRVHLLNARRKLKKELQATGHTAGLKAPAAKETP
ncbi:MAG TPA: sigma-70 family RNA polymerase sigma factor [Patescibacteria group bacterium]|nr:sigma-70 family RNA polymerase sigma factor [Patescibacteria group bacterium]